MPPYQAHLMKATYQSPFQKGGMASYDLTAVLAKNLDKHLVFPLLEFLSLRQIYPEADIEKAKIELVDKTNMVDFLMDIWSSHYKQDCPEEFKERRAQVVDRLETLSSEANSIVSFLSDASLVKRLKQDKSYNLQILQEEFQIGAPQIEALYHFAKHKFECGIYEDAAEFLYHYRTLATSSEKSVSALWGKLASEILMERWETAIEDLSKLRELIDSNAFAPILEQLQQRSWIMHWSLYIFFNHENGRNQIIDLFFQDRYLNTIQTSAQHLLRYLAAAVIVNKRRRNMMKELVKIIEQEAYEYSDPITEFLQNLFVSADFDEAQKKLKECEELIENDYFLTAMKQEFVENARWFIFEQYCRIHQCINLKMLANNLGMPEDAAERWIVNLIRDARLNAKINSAAGTVVMGTVFQTSYEQNLENAKSLSERTFMLANAVGAATRA